MKQKIVFFDIDGTLITEDGNQTLPESTVYAIQELRRRGHLAFINSGRTLFNVIEQPYILRIGFDGYVCACGAHILYRGEHLLTATVPSEAHAAVIDAARRYHMELLLEGPDYFYFDLSIPMNASRQSLYDRFPNHRENVDIPNKCFNKFVTWETPESDTASFVEIAPVEGFYDYKNKYKAGSAVETCPADLPEEVAKEMQKHAVAVCRELGLDSYARMDFLLNENNEMFCLEANTLPGMTATSLLPQEAAVIGIKYEDLCERLIQISQEKYGGKYE